MALSSATLERAIAAALCQCAAKRARVAQRQPLCRLAGLSFGGSARGCRRRRRSARTVEARLAGFMHRGWFLICVLYLFGVCNAL